MHFLTVLVLATSAAAGVAGGRKTNRPLWNQRGPVRAGHTFDSPTSFVEKTQNLARDARDAVNARPPFKSDEAQGHDEPVGVNTQSWTSTGLKDAWNFVTHGVNQKAHEAVELAKSQAASRTGGGSSSSPKLGLRDVDDEAEAMHNIRERAEVHGDVYRAGTGSQKSRPAKERFGQRDLDIEEVDDEDDEYNIFERAEVHGDVYRAGTGAQTPRPAKERFGQRDLDIDEDYDEDEDETVHDILERAEVHGDVYRAGTGAQKPRPAKERFGQRDLDIYEDYDEADDEIKTVHDIVERAEVHGDVYRAGTGGRKPRPAKERFGQRDLDINEDYDRDEGESGAWPNLSKRREVHGDVYRAGTGGRKPRPAKERFGQRDLDIDEEVDVNDLATGDDEGEFAENDFLHGTKAASSIETASAAPPPQPAHQTSGLGRQHAHHHAEPPLQAGPAKTRSENEKRFLSL